MALTQAEIDQFYRDGLLIIPHFFNQAEIDQVTDCSDRLMKVAEKLADEGHSGRVLHQGTQFVIHKIEGKTQIQLIVWAGGMEPQLLKLARQSKLLVPVGQILGSTQADQLINQLHLKLPHDEVAFEWHQDIQHRRRFDPDWQDVNHKGSFVQTIIAIDPMSVENGTICYVPNSHAQGDLFLDKITDIEEMHQKAQVDKAIPMLLNAGDIVFMHPCLVHGSQPNRSEIARKIFINGFAYPGANTKPYPGEGSAQRIDLK